MERERERPKGAPVMEDWALLALVSRIGGRDRGREQLSVFERLRERVAA